MPRIQEEEQEEKEPKDQNPAVGRPGESSGYRLTAGALRKQHGGDSRVEIHVVVVVVVAVGLIPGLLLYPLRPSPNQSTSWFVSTEPMRTVSLTEITSGIV